MSERQNRTRLTKVFVPELGRKVTVRGPTDAELRSSTAEDISTPEAVARVVRGIVGRAVVSPQLTKAQLESLSEESIGRICGARLLLHPETAALRARAAAVVAMGGGDLLVRELQKKLDT